MSTTTPGINACDICRATNRGYCEPPRCICFPGFVGPACQDRVTTTPATSSVNGAAIAAGILGAILATLIICIIIFCIWKRRTKKKIFKLSATNSMATTTSSDAPVVAPALYNITLSDQYSTSNRTESYHLYDELP